MSAAETIRAVLLDLDDTLFDHQHCAREALLGVRGLHEGLAGLDAPALESAHSKILEELHLEVLAGRLKLDAARVERFRRLYLAAGVEADEVLVAQTAESYRTRYIHARKPIEGAAAFLQAIRARAKVVIVSNNLLHEQQEKLRGCDLEPYVDVLVVSEDVGFSKPHRRIFEIALERAGVGPGEAVMVGDSWANDVEGARALGIRAVWFNRNGRQSPDPNVPVLRSLQISPETWTLLFGEPEAATRARA